MIYTCKVERVDDFLQIRFDPGKPDEVTVLARTAYDAENVIHKWCGDVCVVEIYDPYSDNIFDINSYNRGKIHAALYDIIHGHEVRV